jgi:hypothetical protein
MSLEVYAEIYLEIQKERKILASIDLEGKI